MNDTVESRLVELESRLAHHERMAEDLSGVLYEQGRAIERLGAQVRRLTERLATLEAGGGHSPADERPPPHY